MAKALAIAGMAGMLAIAALLFVEDQALASLDCKTAPQADPGYCD